MATEVILPRQGQSVETCLILEWKATEGDSVREGDVLCVVETDKATFEVEATATGSLLKTFYAEGQDAPVLSRIALIGAPGEIAPEISDLPDAPSERESTQAVPAIRSNHDAGSIRADSHSVRISPRARRMAEAEQVQISLVAGSGPHGRIIVRDIEHFLSERGKTHGPQAAPAPEPSAKPGFSAGFEDVPVKGIRKVIAERMLQSVQATAQYTLHASAPAEALLAYRQRLKESPETFDLRDVSIHDMILFATTRLLGSSPELNAHYLGDVIRRFHEVHLGFAVDTPRGLMVPVIRDASRRSLQALADEARRLRTACLDEKISPDELGGATFTVSNLGSLGIEQFTPVLNPPQAGILGVGAIALKPVRSGGEVVFRDAINLSLTLNHQAVDGAPGARFLQRLGAMLEHFDLLPASR